MTPEEMAGYVTEHEPFLKLIWNPMLLFLENEKKLREQRDSSESEQEQDIPEVPEVDLDKAEPDDDKSGDENGEDRYKHVPRKKVRVAEVPDLGDLPVECRYRITEWFKGGIPRHSLKYHSVTHPFNQPQVAKAYQVILDKYMPTRELISLHQVRYEILIVI